MSGTLAVELKGLTKIFESQNGVLAANAGVNLRVAKGSIHGIIGENGAGKSTAMKMLYGQYTPTEGEIWIHGQPKHWKSSQDAIASGIGMVHQHFMLAGPYTALENILLGSTGGAFRLLDFVGSKKRLEALAAQYSLPVNWDARIETLPVGIQQRIEILKLLYRQADILILDEPTAVLTPQETQALFENLKRLKNEGKTILIVTHKLKEVMEITDEVTVFRAGKVTGSAKTAQTSPQGLANLMVGREVQLKIDCGAAPERGKPVLELKEPSLTVQAGEIVGIAGVEGNGQSEVIFKSWEKACAEGLRVALIPEDRHRDGLLLERSVEENFLLGHQRSPQFSKAGWIKSQVLKARAKAAVEKFDVRPRDLDIDSGRLSGGNQQKLIFARELEKNPQFIIAAQPTRGVDVGAIEFIHRQILEARNRGVGVLLISSELDEVMALSDRLHVLYEGKFVAEFKRGHYNEQEVGLRMGGAV
ncbi:ABC transporter ATP-binding protein [bacterium]|nr:ABC transporter ATP-binding protein [bacterium]